LCNVLPIDDFVYFVKFCKDKPWDYIRTICNHYYDCNQYVFCVSYRELMELFPYESLEDTTKIEEICRRVMEEQPQSVVDFKKGKKNSINRLKGQVMKITNGKVNINIVDSTLVRLLSV
jgi:Asp-tRNA(Asn)/Glu-tRNA(Gln) amidotransferase B subunit